MPTLTRLILTLLLIALPSTMLAGDFRFDAPAGPVFSELENKGQREAGARVAPMVLDVFRKGADSIRIPAGDYRFGKERWGREGVIYALEFAGLHRDEAHPFTIDAAGATFWFDLPDDQAPTCHFCVGFKDCRNIIFKGATIDRSTRGHVEGRITQFDFPGNRIELQLSPGVTVPATFNGKLEQRVIPFKADGTFCAPLYALQAGSVHLKYAGILPASGDGRCWVTMGDTKLLDTIKSGGLLRIGDGLSCVYTVTAAIEIIRSGRMVMDGIRVFAAKAWGAERDGDGAHVWRDCYFGPRPGTSQWQDGEGFMFNATRHGTTLDRVTICHTTDDTANFHSYWSPVTSVEGNRVLLGENTETRRALPHGLRLGDSASFLDRNSGEELGRGKITAIEGNQVTLDRSSAPFAHALAEWPDHACAGWLIQNCDWHDNYQRLLIQSGPGIVRNCRFTRFGSAMELNSALSFVEGGVPRDIRIENNTFTDINPQSGGAAITVYSHAYASGYITCWFPAMEGLVKLSALTGDKKYLDAAMTIARFYKSFDRIPVDHSHGMLCCQVSLLLLFEATKDASYLERVEKRWDELVQGGFINPAGGILEKCQLEDARDEGCAEADWLRLNLELGRVTHKSRYWDMAERLLNNHFLQNQSADGGFGHRSILCDKDGVRGFGGNILESTWCCDYHGQIGFVSLRSHLLERNAAGLTCNLALKFTAKGSAGTVKSTMRAGVSAGEVMRQRIQLDGLPASVVRIRQPQWADSVTAIAADGSALPLIVKNGYCSTGQPVTSVEFVYFGGVYAEGRRCNRLPNGPVVGQLFALGFGPKLFAAANQSVALPAWPTTVEALKAQGVGLFSPALRSKDVRFVFDRRKISQ